MAFQSISSNQGLNPPMVCCSVKVLTLIFNFQNIRRSLTKMQLSLTSATLLSSSCNWKYSEKKHNYLLEIHINKKKFIIKDMFMCKKVIKLRLKLPTISFGKSPEILKMRNKHSCVFRNVRQKKIVRASARHQEYERLSARRSQIFDLCFLTFAG